MSMNQPYPVPYGMPPQPMMPRPMPGLPMPPQPAPALFPLPRRCDQQLATRMILESIQGERHDELFYDYLISVAPTQQEKEVITSIRNDERKHRQMFRTLYYQLTGQLPPVQAEELPFQRPASYLQGLQDALIGELQAFERYRTILLNLCQPPYRDALFEIMMDEIKHAGYYNWLYAKNK